MKLITCILLTILIHNSNAQPFIIKDVKSFGAKGDGKTNDQAAFKKASAYFNKRGGFGKLVISKGIYMVGTQVFTGGQLNKPAYVGENILEFTNIKNFSIEGKSGAIIKYKNNQRFGAFSPRTGVAYEHGNNYFVDPAFLAIPGICISVENCINIKIYNLALDGNNQNLKLGGIYGDAGRQIPHTGIFIVNSRNVIIEKVNAHHFGLDGIMISNKKSGNADSVQLLSSNFEYNSRQGLSWIGGNQLYVSNCKFNHTGKGKFNSPPGAGADIEAESGEIRNGIFERCEFVDNYGCGLVADGGYSSDCKFINCTFWGTTNWSLWVRNKNFTFLHCNVYGSFVHGYGASELNNATQFTDCHFEDKPYKSVTPFGNYLVETNSVMRMRFTGCSFTSNIKKLCWFDSPESFTTEEKYQLINCTFTINNKNLPFNDFAGILRGVNLKNCTFTFTNPEALKKQYYLGGYAGKPDPDTDGNRMIYK